MNKTCASRIMLIFLAFSISNVLFCVPWGHATSGEPKSVYIEKNLNQTGLVRVKSDSPSNFYKILNTINISSYSIVTGYQFGYESSGTTLNITIASNEKNRSISEIRAIPANDPAKSYKRIFESNSSMVFVSKRNINLSMEVVLGNNYIDIQRGSPTAISKNAFYWSDATTRWMPLELYDYNFAAIVEPVPKIELNKTTGHAFSNSSNDGYIDAFIFNRSDFTHDSALRFKIDKTNNPLAGNISFELYLADSGMSINNLTTIIKDNITDTLFTKTFDFDHRPYQEQEFILILRSLENKNMGYNITMYYINPPSSGDSEPWLNTAGIIVIVVVGVLVLVGVGYYIWKSQR